MTEGGHESGWWQASDGKWYPPETLPSEDPVAAAEPEAAPAPADPDWPSLSPAEPVGPLAAAARAASTLTVAPPPVPPAASDPPPPPPKRDAHVPVTFDADGWITIDEPRTAPVAPPAPPRWRSAAITLGGIAVALVVVILAAVTFIPKTHRPSDDAIGGATPTTDDGSASVDPLTLDSVLSGINVQFSDVGHGYQKVIDGSVDPLGGDGCTQPRRPFVDVDGTNWTAYDYQPDGLGGFPLGHLAAAVTVFHTQADAAKRLKAEQGLDYVACLQRWDRWVWFDGSDLTPTQEKMVPLTVKVAGAKAIAWRYEAAFQDGGKTYGLYTDNVVFTKGRLRTWIEVSSAIAPFDQSRRDLLISRMSARVDQALA